MVPTLPAPASSTPAGSASSSASATPVPPKEPEIPALKPAENATCVFSETDIDLAASLPLRVDDSPPFVYVGKGRKVEVRLASPRSTASIANDDRDLIGNVSLGDVTVRPKSTELVDGFVRVRQAHLKPLSGATGRYVLGYDLPSHVKAEHDSHVEVSCGDVALARSTGSSGSSFGFVSVELRTGIAIPLRATPGGPVVARIELPKSNGSFAILNPHVAQLERKGADVKISLRGNATDIEGWITAKDLAKPTPSDLVGVLGAGMGFPVQKALAVTRDTPIYARYGSRVVRVGTAKQGDLTCADKNDAGPGEVSLALDGAWGGFGGLGGLGGLDGIGGLGSARPRDAEVPVTVFVKPTAGETCVVPKKK